MKKNYNLSLIDYLSGFVTENRLERFDTVIKSRTRHITIALEDIYQPHNASAVLRTCDCTGIQDIHIIENENTYHVNQDVALGSSKWVSLIKYNSSENNTMACISNLKEQGYSIVATTPHKNDCMIDELPLESKTALFFGTELNGISHELIEHADAFVKIPMYGFTESYNISVSAAICLYSLTQRLRNSNVNWHLSETEIVDIKLQWLKNTLLDAALLEKEFQKKIV
ncbi:MAG: RNA methyltransferase [Bacteroidota bacterium]